MQCLSSEIRSWTGKIQLLSLCNSFSMTDVSISMTDVCPHSYNLWNMHRLQGRQLFWPSYPSQYAKAELAADLHLTKDSFPYNSQSEIWQNGKNLCRVQMGENFLLDKVIDICLSDTLEDWLGRVRERGTGRGRERGRERGSQGERERERERENNYGPLFSQIEALYIPRLWRKIHPD